MHKRPAAIYFQTVLTAWSQAISDNERSRQRDTGLRPRATWQVSSEQVEERFLILITHVLNYQALTIDRKTGNIFFISHKVV